jgi:hypothetical protein
MVDLPDLKPTTTTITKPLLPNKLGYVRNEIQSESIRSEISNMNDNDDDEKNTTTTNN